MVPLIPRDCNLPLLHALSTGTHTPHTKQRINTSAERNSTFQFIPKILALFQSPRMSLFAISLGQKKQLGESEVTAYRLSSCYHGFTALPAYQVTQISHSPFAPPLCYIILISIQTRHRFPFIKIYCLGGHG